MVKVCIIGKQQPRYIRDKMKNAIENSGFSADILDMPTRDVKDYAERLSAYDAIISAGESIDAAALSELKNLKLISRFGIGTNEIDKEEATKRGIAVCNAAGTFSECVAECAMFLTLALVRQFPFREKELRNGDWSAFYDGKNARQLYGKTVGLIGFGKISRTFAKMLKAFGCEVLAYDPYAKDDEFKESGVLKRSLAEIARESDVISLHAPLTPETENVVNDGFISEMKTGAILVNTSRGGLVDENAVAAALNGGKLAGYGADVFRIEPLPQSSEIMRAKNTILLPHSASNGIEAVEAAGMLAAQNAIDFFGGKDVKTVLNPDYKKYAKQ